MTKEELIDDVRSGEGAFWLEAILDPKTKDVMFYHGYFQTAEQIAVLGKLAKLTAMTGKDFHVLCEEND